MRHLFTTLIILMTALTVQAQNKGFSKLSPWLRQLTMQEKQATHAPHAQQSHQGREVCAFIKLSDSDEEVLQQYGCRSLMKKGNLHVATIPVGKLRLLSADSRVVRIEARPMGQTLLDTLPNCINAVDAHRGANLPQAFTGKDVVVGVMDIGFDLTNPTFYSRDHSAYRVKALWDMLSRDTIGSAFPVGRDFVGKDTLLSLAHSFDGLDNTHGTYTAGIAAGSGYDSPYQGVAPEADICLVANAVSNNAALVDSALYDRFTFATDALGFKYIFDYATSVGKPCVASLSEGSGQDFWGYDLLYYEMLDSLVGPGRILVAAAGNLGGTKSWFRKDKGISTKGTFLKGTNRMYLTLKSADDFMVRLVSYGTGHNDTLTIKSKTVCDSQDSLLTITSATGFDSLQVQAYPSCYVPTEMCYDLQFYSQHVIGYDLPLSLELLGENADVEYWRGSSVPVENSLNNALCAGEEVRNIHSPSSAPCVISVGATTYRDSILNKNGQWMAYHKGEPGKIAPFSSKGPTMDGRIKPDVVAPGNNIISSLSSFFLQKHPDAGDVQWNVKEFECDGRIYAWNSNSGTSSSCPAVAGAVAVWLQAKPDLIPDEVKGILQRTSRHPDATLSYPNNVYGYGEIDVYRGLLDILQVDQITEVSAQHTAARVSMVGRLLKIELPQQCDNAITIKLFALSGQQVFRYQLPVGQSDYSIPLPSMPSGIYAVQIDGNRMVNGSTLVHVP